MIVRPMREDECAAVAGMVRALARETGAASVPRLTQASLGANACGADRLLDVVVAEREGRLAGACLALMTFSTWRGVKGLYIVDLYVEDAERGQGLGARLLRAAAARGRARGARFVKLEVDQDNYAAARFYERLGFARKHSERLFVLEPEALDEWLAG